MSKEALEFVVYLIHACARKWGQTPAMIYHKLEEFDCIGGYLIPNYDVLHTQGTAYLVEDIEEYIRVRGGNT